MRGSLLSSLPVSWLAVSWLLLTWSGPSPSICRFTASSTTCRGVLAVEVLNSTLSSRLAAGVVGMIGRTMEEASGHWRVEEGDCGTGIGEREGALVVGRAGESGGVVRTDSALSEVVEAGEEGLGA